jgi:CheY-like chemotaxis protein
MTRITVVNDNREFLELMEDVLRDELYETTTVDGDRPDALEAIIASRPDLLVIDLRMGTDVLHGWTVAQQVRGDDRFRELPILVCSADIMALHEMESELAGLHRVRALPKPFSIDELTDAIDELRQDTAAA